MPDLPQVAHLPATTYVIERSGVKAKLTEASADVRSRDLPDACRLARFEARARCRHRAAGDGCRRSIVRSP